ncbi:MAG: hypothetical protein U0736_08675 [Gemmataceae bacterium]
MPPAHPRRADGGIRDPQSPVLFARVRQLTACRRARVICIGHRMDELRPHRRPTRRVLRDGRVVTTRPFAGMVMKNRCA